jgi:hypothetical protein
VQGLAQALVQGPELGLVKGLAQVPLPQGLRELG